MKEILAIFNFLDLFDWIMLILLLACMISLMHYENKNFMNGHINYTKRFSLYWLCIVLLVTMVHLFGNYFDTKLLLWVHDKIDTILFIYVFTFINSLYVKYGGITFKEIKDFIKNKNKIKNFKLFSNERRIKVMLLKYNSFEEKMIVIDKVVDFVTKKLIKYTSSYKKWNITDNNVACLFVKELQRISDEAYKILDNIGLDNKSRKLFLNIIELMTPEFNKRVKNILINRTFTSEQRRDLTLEELEIIGNDIQHEVKKLIEFMQQYEKE